MLLQGPEQATEKTVDFVKFGLGLLEEPQAYATLLFPRAGHPVSERDSTR